MSTEKQIAASRENGKKSRGPVTEEGKRRSSRNAETHGLFSRTITLDSEALERFDSLLNALIEVLRPVDEIEMLAVEGMAVAKWRQMRFWEMSTAEHSDEIREQVITAPDLASKTPALRAAKAFNSLSDRSNLARLGVRYEASFDRLYHRNLRLLQERRRKNIENPKRT